MRRIASGPQVCGHVAEGTSPEPLEPDGRRGYAMGTVGGLSAGSEGQRRRLAARLAT